jgi:hypothetical protein
MTQPSTHPTLTFALDIADKLIKLAAVLIGAFWTWWNYRKSRTYEQKLELEISGNVFVKDGDLYGDVRVAAKNIGATRHAVQQTGTSCEILTIGHHLEESSAETFPIFVPNKNIEPSESINETIVWCIPKPITDIVWIKLILRVASNKLEWNSSLLIRVEAGESANSVLSER